MKIYDQEKLDGLEETIKASASISYASLATPASLSEDKKLAELKTIASIDDSDLYYVQSILVSSSWNKNDDIFDKAEVWNARNTPEDKPTNLEHDESTIIGHITANWPITEEGILIDENTPVANLPDKYHILTASVIYRGFSKPELRERAEKLIAEVESGEKYVSMECFFKGFDYGLLNKDTGEFKVLARNNNTAFLTKHLRAYGGMGEHENYKLGRVLRNITFSGKGFVAKPANPDSIIFTKDNLLNKNDINTLEKKDDFSLSGVFNNQSNLNVVENSTMNSDITEPVVDNTEANDCSEQIKQAHETASELQNKTVELENAIKAKEAELEQVKAELNNTIQEINDAIAKKDEDMKKKEAEMMKKEEEMKKMKADLDAATETIAAYKSKEEEMMKKEKKMKRVAELLDKGIQNEVAVSTVDKFENLDDATFESITSLLAGVAVKQNEAVAEEIIEDKKSVSEEVPDVSVLETAEPQETTDLSVGQEDIESSVSSTRAALVDFVYSRLGTITK
jgi:uncharacterized coiled-coil protein SlyX